MKRRSFLKLPAAVATLFVPFKLAAAEKPLTTEALQYVGRPSTACVGDYYQDLSSGLVHVYNGNTWLQVV